MPADLTTEPLPPWLYRSEAFAEDLIDDAPQAGAADAPGPWRRAAIAAGRRSRGLYGWLQHPLRSPPLAG